jgi:hypothetical protein
MTMADHKEKWTGPIGRLLEIDGIKADGGPGRSVVYQMINDGVLEAVKLGSRTRVTERSWEAHKRSLPRLNTSESPRAA